MIKYTTLWDIIVKKFIADEFVHFAASLGFTKGVFAGGELFAEDRIRKATKERMDEKDRTFYLVSLEQKNQECLHLGLVMSAKTINRLLARLSTPTITWEEFDELCNELKGRLVDEMQSMTFFSIEPDKQSLVLEKSHFGAEVTAAFPSTITDIEEAGKCLAFDRATACVFHLMRVMEIGLRALRDRLRLITNNNPSWGHIIEQIEEALKKCDTDKPPEWQNDKPFFVDAIAILRSVKNAWRNPTMHIEKVYTEEQAEDIWNAVKGFMRHLATKLK